jgi:hypothetical protein
MTAVPIDSQDTAPVRRNSKRIRTLTTTTAPAMATNSNTKTAIAKPINRVISKATTGAASVAKFPSLEPARPHSVGLLLQVHRGGQRARGKLDGEQHIRMEAISDTAAEREVGRGRLLNC